MKYVLLLLSVLGCNRGMQPKIASGVDPAFQVYSQEFAEYYHTDQSVPIHFSTLNSSPLGELVGECVTYSDGARQILIDPGYWSQLDEVSRKDVIYHELGHCKFGRVHTSAILNDLCPTSIMNPYVFGDPCWAEHEAQYLTELP